MKQVVFLVVLLALVVMVLPVTAVDLGRSDDTTVTSIEESQIQSTYVTLTLYVHESSTSGPLLSNVQVTGSDGAGNPFSKITSSGGYVTITGTPGTWSFTASKSEYDSSSWSQSITTSCERHAYLVPSVPVQDVTLTLYMHSGSSSGPLLSNVQVTGYDGAGNYFSKVTDSNGYVMITGTPGSWQFTASKSGYTSESWSETITTSVTRNGFLQVNQVTLTLYMHEGSSSGPLLSGVLITGTDGTGKSFSTTTNSAGYVTISGTPGSWQFAASKSGYKSESWSDTITGSVAKNGFLQINQITVTLYMHEGSSSGPLLSNVQVTGCDGTGNYFSEVTDSSGHVTITGTPGSWQFTALKSGYKSESWSDTITTSVTRNGFLQIDTPSQVVLTLYMHESSSTGPLLSGVLVTGTDGAGSSFSATTNSAGYVTISGTPGSWQFTASKSKYKSKSWSDTITTSVTRYGFLQIDSSSPGGSQPIFKAPWEGSARITQGTKGTVSHYDHGTWDNTYALDITSVTPSETFDVLAPYDGTVCYVDNDGTDSGGGKEVAIRHTIDGNEYITVYLHLSEILVANGASLNQGEKFAVSGMTGGATGIHLHFHLYESPGSYDSHTQPIERIILKKTGVDSNFKEYDQSNGDLDESVISKYDNRVFESNNVKIAPEQPKLYTSGATAVTSTSAVLHGHLAKGKAGETYEVCFRYEGGNVGKTKIGSVTVSASNPSYEYLLTGLTPGTTYYYRAVHKDSEPSQPNLIDASSSMSFTTTTSPPSGLAIGDTICLTANVLVRGSAGTGEENTIIDAMIKGNRGELIDGPKDADGYTWWKVRYDIGVEGWSADYMAKAPATPQAPTGFSSWAEDAIKWGENWKGTGDTYWNGYCLRFVANSFRGGKAEGISNWLSAILAASDLYRINQEPEGWVHAPRGAVIFFDNEGTNTNGHVGIYLGNNRVLHAWGTVKNETISEALDKPDVGRYLGWSYPYENWRTLHINSFEPSSSEVKLGEIVSFNYEVSSTGASIKQIELWRNGSAENPEGSPRKITSKTYSPMMSVKDTITDTPGTPDAYWYGLRIYDVSSACVRAEEIEKVIVASPPQDTKSVYFTSDPPNVCIETKYGTGSYVYRYRTPAYIPLSELTVSPPSTESTQDFQVFSESISDQGEQVEIKFTKYGYQSKTQTITLGDQNSVNIELTPETPPPDQTDLLISRVWTSDAIQPGKEVQIGAEIINDGDIGCGPFNVGLWANNDQNQLQLIGKREISYLSPKSTTTVSGWKFIWPNDYEMHPVIVWVDCDNSVPETDEINNLFPGKGEAKEEPPMTPPKASFSAFPTSGTVPLTVEFIDTSTGDPTSWLWDFGDGQSASGPNPIHTYTHPKVYSVTLTVGNAGGENSLTKQRCVEVTEGGTTPTPTPNNPPNIPSVPSGSTSGTTGVSYTYSTSATDPDGNLVKYTFDWDDGTTSEVGLVSSGITASASHSWNYPGIYSVKAKATDSGGASSEWSGARTVTITTNNPPNSEKWEVVETIQFTENKMPLVVAISGRKAYVGSDPGGLTIIDLDTNEIADTISFSPYPRARPGYIDFSGDKAYIALSNLGSGGQLAVINTDEGTISTYIPVGIDPWGVATLNNKVFVTNNVHYTNGNPATVRVINTDTNSITASVPVGINPICIAINPITKKAYVANVNDLSKSINVINTDTNAVVATIPMDSPPKAVAIVGNYAYVTAGDWQAGLVEVVDTETNQIISCIQVGQEAVGIAKSDSHIFVANQFSDTLGVINTTTNSVVAVVEVGHNPTFVAVDPLTNKVFVTNQGDRTISVIKQNNDSVETLFASFTTNTTTGFAPLAVQFSDTSTGNPTAWSWTFGDGATSDLQHPTHTYTTPGAYPVTLTVTNAEGSDIATKTDYITVSAQPEDAPEIEWQRCLGGSLEDYGRSVQQTSDGGYILTGWTNSTDSAVGENHGGIDIQIVKLDTKGSVQWQRCYGGSGDDSGAAVRETGDGGYILIGSIASNDGDVSGNHGGDDVWVARLDMSGTILWQRCLGGVMDDWGMSIQQTADGGYILTGCTQSNGDDVSGNHGGGDVWVVRLSASGDIQWQRCLGGSDYESGYAIQQASDGGYILIGETWSNDGDVSGKHGDDWNSDVWVVKLDATGNINWQRCLGGSDYEAGYAIQQTSDGGYILIGETWSNDGNVSGKHGSEWESDAWVVKLDATGNINWQRCLGGSGSGSGDSIQQANDGGYILAGSTSSIDGDVSGTHGDERNSDIWVVKLDATGNINWQRCLGGLESEWGESVQQAADGGYILTGDTWSNDGDVNGNHGARDAWVVKLASDDPVPVHPPTTNFTANTTSGPAPLTVRFTDTSPNSSTAWLWTFGDGATSTEQHPVHTYTAAGTYTVSLNASNAGGSSTETKTGYITVMVPPPVANFTANVNAGVAPLTVRFTDTTTENPSSWLWDFGDRNTSTDQNPIHTYRAPGTYTVSLNASNAYGFSAETKTDHIIVLEPPAAAFTALPTEGNAPLAVQFTDQSTGNVTAWNWSFGDGNTSTDQNPTHTYATAGTYTVGLNASNAYRYSISTPAMITVLEPPTAAFTANVTEGNVPLAVRFTDQSTGNVTAWRWSFGDDTTSTEQSPIHTYRAPGTYTVSLNASNAGSSSTETKTDYITVIIPPPVAAFTTSVTEGNAPLTIRFTDTSTGEITARLWSFGDGATATTRNSTHTYSEAGTYTTRLTITGPGGDDVAERIITVTPPATGAAFTANITAGVAPLTVRFTDTSPNSPTAWLWTFGDGATSTEQHPVHTYTLPGNHTVTLSVDGGAEACTKPGYIKVTPILFGDATEDGEVNQADTLLVLQQVVGLREKHVAGTDEFQKTDVNQNGAIDVGDALFIAQYNVGLRDVWFGVL
ncbi:PKD domain-containing protein [Methanoculleus sp.]|uniref:PKD domain-containing protein n=1 Tax=Methanoculleus sp. TaxID=90427 RepID=UPI00321130F5